VSDACAVRVEVAPAAALEVLAHELLVDFREAAPDLSGAVVVLPNLHAAGALARIIGSLAGGPVMLPKMTTLGMWAAEHPVAFEPLPEVVREAALFDALRSRKWFDAANLWPLAGELSRLFDELTQFEIALPQSVEEFEGALEAAYQAKAGTTMQLEARLVYELWRASSQSGDGAVGAVAAYQMQLSCIARDASQPLYAIGLPELIPAEQAFLEAYSANMPVKVYQITGDADGASESARFYASAWPVAGDEAEFLRERAAAFARSVPESPVAGSLRLYGAPSLEHEARAAETQVRFWLNEGCKKVAVVALDRLVARRARALLERSRVMTDDETGWIFSTTSASTVVMRWLDAVSSDFYFKDLLDLVKSPYIFPDWVHRREAVYELERAVRSHSVIAGLEACRAAMKSGGGEFVHGTELVDRVADAARLLPRDRRRSLREWLSLLFGSLGALGVEDGLRSDPAGLQLVDYLQRLERELGSSVERFSFGEWRSWLDRQLERAEFRDNGVSSPVIFTQLSLTRLREFDAVVLIGCDAAHLPGTDQQNAFFSESVRAQLGLPTSGHRVAQIVDDLSGLLCRSARVLVTWQMLREAEHNLPSPLFERVSVFHQLAWGASLDDHELALKVIRSQVAPPYPASLPSMCLRPAPTVAPERLPERISASAYNSLVACPYQFYGRYVLGLREPEQVREEMEKREYGEYVHRILRRFHAHFPVCSTVARQQLEAVLGEISERVFREASEANYLSHAWALRWRATNTAYLDWQLEREREGWQFHAAESKREIAIVLPDGAMLILEGRLDRIDTRNDNEHTGYAVIDYKTRAPNDLRRTVSEPGEDVQLPVYAALLEDDVQEAFYLAIDNRQVRRIGKDDGVLADVEQAIERLKNIFVRIRGEAPLVAQGTESACQWCELHGLCRKQYWHDDGTTDPAA